MNTIGAGSHECKCDDYGTKSDDKLLLLKQYKTGEYLHTYIPTIWSIVSLLTVAVYSIAVHMNT